MRTRTRYALYAGIVAVAASGCAMGGRQTASADNPAARRVEASQERSQEALSAANEAQERASQEQQRAAEAQQELREAQRALNEAQQRAEQATARAEEAQRQANEATRRATQQAQQAQQQATQQLARQEQLVTRGEQVLSGQVTRSTSRQLEVQLPNGDPMSFALTPRTRVEIDGRQAAASDLTPGEDARVSYELSGTEPTALLVQVMRGVPSGTGTGSGSMAPPASGTSGGSAEEGTGSAEGSEAGTGTTPADDRDVFPRPGGDVETGTSTGETSGTPPER